jgi:hypothetical protein
MTVDDFRDQANAALEKMKARIMALPSQVVFGTALSQSPIPTAEINLAPRIETLQKLESDCLEVLTTISDAVSKFQDYQTAAINPAGLGDNAPTGNTNS